MATRCIEYTLEGQRCGNPALFGTNFCWIHGPTGGGTKTAISRAGTGAGRHVTKKPTAKKAAAKKVAKKVAKKAASKKPAAKKPAAKKSAKRPVAKKASAA
jgi:hypothetical protein